jgi:hypothetical protein
MHSMALLTSCLVWAVNRSEGRSVAMKYSFAAVWMNADVRNIMSEVESWVLVLGTVSGFGEKEDGSL